MLRPDETYDEREHAAHALAALRAADTFLHAHNIRPDFFCRYREKMLLQRALQAVETSLSGSARAKEPASGESNAAGRGATSGADSGAASGEGSGRSGGRRHKRRRQHKPAPGNAAGRGATSGADSGAASGEGSGWSGGRRHKRRRQHKPAPDASSSNEAVHLQQRLLSLSSELVTLRNHLHVGGAAGAGGGLAPAAPAHAPAAPPAKPAHPPAKVPAPLPQTSPGAVQPAVPPRAAPAPPAPAPPPPANINYPQDVARRWRGGGGGGGGAGADLDDLIHLRGPLTEDAVVKTLHARFYANKFYTNVGPILVALNAYTDTGNPLTLTAARAGGRPELARLVHDAVRQQADTGYPQAIILSGTSGSGKTYASMLLLRRLFDVAGGGPETDAFKHLAAAFTVLRSLGSAGTAANSHSSRIGHFIEVQVTDGALYRTKIHCYFLDQTRVIRLLPHEKNYHIFYQMLAGLSHEERVKLHLDGYGPTNLRYLQFGDTRQNEAEDAARFQSWKVCLGILGIPFLDVVRVLAAVLLLGNVQFSESGTHEPSVEVTGEPELNSAAALLGVSSAALFRGLGSRTRTLHGQTVRATCDADACAASRDALAKALYCRTVATIVRRANSLKRLGSTLGTLSSDSNESVHNQGDAASRRASTVGGSSANSKSMAALNNAVRHVTDGFVGILDMFGFEDAGPSRLEHLCINLCAETMQHFYNTHIFKSSIESCREEGIGCDLEVDYVDNVPCIDLVSSLRAGLLALLDADCVARGTPESYVARVRAQHRHNDRLFEPRPPDARRFGVRHYAGDVVYDVSDFIDANRDVVPDDLVAAFHRRGCEFGFATHLFGGELKTLFAGGAAPRGASFRASPTSHAEPMDGDEPVSSLTQDFHTRLDNLLRTLVHARPHFVRCVRANRDETPMLFERATVARQIRALQTLETVNLMAGGYPHRMRFRAFASRYRALGPRCSERDTSEACSAVLHAVDAGVGGEKAGGASVRWALGKRHVFLSEGMRQILERARRGRRRAAAECIQAAWRRHRTRAPPPGRAPPAPAPHPPAASLAAVAAPAATPAHRPRPAPIAGTPPPDPADKCDPALVRQTCTLFGLDLERPPPLPPSRAYTVAGGVKLGYPQSRVMKLSWPESGEPVLHAGDAVLVVGAGRRGHLTVALEPGGRRVQVPYHLLQPPRARPAPPAPPAAPLSPPPSAAPASAPTSLPMLIT